MKAVQILAIFLCAMACSDDTTTYSVSPELSTYVNSFFSEGELRGKNLPKQNLIATVDSGCQSITAISKDGEQWILKFDKEIFESMEAQGNPNNKIESFIFHELGRIVLKRELATGNSIMNGFVKVNGYPDSQREELLDELFQ